ncbi:MAG: hypothetical protein JHD16_04895 [Solirubrobacteraceae bacterium]|nr:hypothetical protein [Solirubrobacteraceae bacterium]
MALRLNLTIDDEHAAVLIDLAERTHMQPGTLARSMLLTTLESTAARNEAAKAPSDVVALLNSIPGALEDHRAGLQEIADGHAGHSIDEI